MQEIFSEIKTPIFKATSFACPFCNIASAQNWGIGRLYHGGESSTKFPNLWFSHCHNCQEYAVWFNEKLLYPKTIIVPNPNSDMDSDIQDLYNEAALILNDSPRAAAALLRLAVQKLCLQLGEKGKDIDKDIANLVKKGLDPLIQKSLDIIRVIGNHAVHPGQIIMDDNHDLVIKLFYCLNFITKGMITNKREIENMYNSLPNSNLEAIQKRDGECMVPQNTAI